jgi:hypothetical protein
MSSSTQLLDSLKDASPVCTVSSLCSPTHHPPPPQLAQGWRPLQKSGCQNQQSWDPQDPGNGEAEQNLTDWRDPASCLLPGEAHGTQEGNKYSGSRWAKMSHRSPDPSQGLTQTHKASSTPGSGQNVHGQQIGPGLPGSKPLLRGLTCSTSGREKAAGEEQAATVGKERLIALHSFILSRC